LVGRIDTASGSNRALLSERLGGAKINRNAAATHHSQSASGHGVACDLDHEAADRLGLAYICLCALPGATLIASDSF
jgi:hypothetical protein